MISSTVTALVFAVFIKCPMFFNEQCDKAPYGPVGAAWQPHSHASHSLNLFDDGFTVSLVQCIFIPNENWQTPKNYSGARPYVSCLGRSEGANNIWGSKMIQPQNSIWTEETSEWTNAYWCTCPSVTFRPPCIAEDNQTPKTTYLFCPCLIWY